MKGKKMSENRPYSYEIDDTDSWDRTFGTLDWGSEERDSGNGCRYPRQPNTETFLRGVLTLLADKRNQNNKHFACDCDALLYSALCDKEFCSYLSCEAKTGLIISLIAYGANVKDDHIFSNASRAINSKHKGGLWSDSFSKYERAPYNMSVFKCMIAAGADVNDYRSEYSYYDEGYGERECGPCPLIDDILFHKEGGEYDNEVIQLLVECGANMDEKYWYSVYDDANDDKREWREKQPELRRNYLNGNSPHSKEMKDAKRFLNSLGCEISAGRIQMALIKLQLFTESGFVFGNWRDMAKSDKEMTQRVYKLKNKFKNFDLETKDMFGYTLLSEAIWKNYTETANTLISLGADMKKPIVLTRAVLGENIEMIEELVKRHGVDINRGPYGALNEAAANRTENIELAEKLIELGADVNGIDASSWTPLHEAIHSARMKRSDAMPIVKLLIERGADVNIQNKFGQTPLDMLMDPRDEIKHREEMKELIRNAAKIRADYLARQTQPTIVAKRNHENTDSGRQYS